MFNPRASISSDHLQIAVTDQGPDNLHYHKNASCGQKKKHTSGNASVLWGRYSDSLRAERSGDQIPVGARFFAAVQTGPRAHPASYTKGTGPFPGGGVKRPGRGADPPPPT